MIAVIVLAVLGIAAPVAVWAHHLRAMRRQARELASASAIIERHIDASLARFRAERAERRPRSRMPADYEAPGPEIPPGLLIFPGRKKP